MTDFVPPFTSQDSPAGPPNSPEYVSPPVRIGGPSNIGQIKQWGVVLDAAVVITQIKPGNQVL